MHYSLTINIFTHSIKYAIIIISLLLACSCSKKSDELNELVEKLATENNCEIGLALIIDSSDTITYNTAANERFPLMSVFKFHQALAVCHTLDSLNICADSTNIAIAAEDMFENTYSPLRDKYPAGIENISVKELLEYTLQLSDNIACDILFDRICSVEQTDSYIHAISPDPDFNIGATEREMSVNMSASDRNNSTPLAAAALMDKFIFQGILSADSQEMIRNIMENCTTGQKRIAYPLKNSNAIIGHKTGTGFTNPDGSISAINDLAYIILPNGTHYTLAVFVTNAESMDSGENIIATISEHIYNTISI